MLLVSLLPRILPVVALAFRVIVPVSACPVIEPNACTSFPAVTVTSLAVIELPVSRTTSFVPVVVRITVPV